MPYELYIDGKWCGGKGGRASEIKNPATGEVIASAACGGTEDAKRAMDAAAAAFPAWRDRPPHERSPILLKTARLIRERVQDIARVLTEENGKTLRESIAETKGTAAWFEWYAEEAKRNCGKLVESAVPGKRLWVMRQPVGVVAAIAPWNFPVNLMCRKLAAGLAAGCTVVARPASKTPLSTMKIFECLHDAGLPAGAASLVTGPAGPLAETMLDHPACRKVAFTGSTEVGKELMARAAKRMIRVSLELGGHAPALVFPDVEIADAAEKTVLGKFRNTGQSCIAPTRIYVHRKIYDAFRDAVVARASRMVVGNGLRDDVEMGPLFSKSQFEETEGFVADAVEKGGKVLTGGKRLTGGEYDRGYFYAPTVIDNIHRDMRLMTEEIFGPILPLIPFEDEKQGVAEANRTEYGLAAYILTRDLGIAVRVGEALEAGVLGVNDYVPTVPQAPFGGWKESGIGREGGPEGLDAYLETKFISVAIQG